MAAGQEIELALSTLSRHCAVRKPDIQTAFSPLRSATEFSSSARNSSDCGIVMPSDLAVFKLMTSSNLNARLRVLHEGDEYWIFAPLALLAALQGRLTAAAPIIGLAREAELTPHLP
jgi:hypothetical protein